MGAIPKCKILPISCSDCSECPSDCGNSENMEKPFLMYCPSCGHKHRMINQPCPMCQGRGGYTPQPISEKVYDSCHANYDCDGCEAYREHES